MDPTMVLGIISTADMNVENIVDKSLENSMIIRHSGWTQTPTHMYTHVLTL